jgi:DNA-binding NarL/FixJ family response regulator
MLPVIRTQARFAFRHLGPEARQDAVQEAVANALVAFVRLVELRKTDVAYPSALVRFAVAQILETLSRRDRRIAKTLAMGHTTGDVARRFRLSPGRISQLRQALRLSWQEFQGETPDGSQTEIGPE